jgi:hypothetical protein
MLKPAHLEHATTGMPYTPRRLADWVQHAVASYADVAQMLPIDHRLMLHRVLSAKVECAGLCMSCMRSQTRKLQEMFKALQVEKEQLRRQYEELQQRTGMRNGGPAGGAAARAGLASRPSGHGSGRQVSLFQGSPVGTQMVSVNMSHGS